MALRQHGFEIDVALDNIMIENERKYTVFKSGQDVTYLRSANPTYDNTSISWSVTPSANVWVDRRMLMTFKGRFTLNASAVPVGWAGCVQPSADGGLSGIDGVRWMPVQSQCTNCDLQINNGSISTNPSIFLEAVTRYGWDQLYEESWLGSSPSMHDNSQTYHQTFQTNRNCLGGVVDNVVQCPRGGLYYNIISNTVNTAVVEVEWSEMFIMASPMLSPSEYATGIWNVETLNLALTLQNGMSKAWSHNATDGATLTSVSFEFTTAPILTIRQVNPIGGIPAPMETRVLPYHQIKTYQDQGEVDLAVGVSATTTLQSLTLNGIPSRAYIFCKKNQNAFTFNDCDCYARITNVSVDFGPKSNLLGNVPEDSIYQMCVSNGLKYSFQEWKRYQGSVLCIDFGTDISLDPLMAVGMSDKLQMQITLTYQNIGSSSVTYTCYQVVLFEGLFVYEDGTSQTVNNALQVGDLTNEHILNAKQSRAAHVNMNYMGGSFRDSTKKLYHQGVNAAKGAIQKYGPTVAKYAKQYAPSVIGAVSPRAGEIAKILLGSGLEEDEIFNALRKMGFTVKEINGAGVYGGCCTGRGVSGGRIIEDASSLLEEPKRARRSLRDRS